VHPGGDIGVKQNRLHGRGSGKIAVTLGVGEGQDPASSSSDSKVSAVSSSSERIGWAFLAASSWLADSRG
jgi:hypothetical protein